METKTVGFMADHSVIGVIFSKDKSKVLLIKRRDVPVWVLPGGGIEAHESPEKAILREVLEETGYHVQITRKIGEYTPVNKLAKYTYLYETKVLNGAPTIGEETKEIQFFPLSNLPTLIPPPYPEWIIDAKKNHSEIVRKRLTSVNYTTLLKSIFSHPILVMRFLLSKIGLTINT